jgi:hypothetical protein
VPPKPGSLGLPRAAPDLPEPASPGTLASPSARGTMPVVVGCPRSGTTLITVMLDSHPAIAMLPETAFLPHLAPLAAKPGGPSLREFFRLVTTDRWSRSNWNDIGIDKEAYWRRLYELETFSLTVALRVLYGMYADALGKHLFGEKTPADTHCMPLIEALLPEARFIHIIRDPRNVVLSINKTSIARSVEETARVWVDAVSVARASGQRVRHYHEVRFEDLVGDPENVLRAVCRFLDLAYSSLMLEYEASGARHVNHLGDRMHSNDLAMVPRELRAQLHPNLTRPLQTNRVATWRQEMSERDCATVEAFAGPLMRSAAYQLTGASAR